MTVSDTLSLAINAARAAGTEILKIYNSNYDAWEKEGNAPVTDADIASEKIILNMLRASAYSVLSEETDDDLARLSEKTIWVVDPLDGTQDFLNKTGEFSVLIGLVQKERPILGVIYQPTADKLYYGEKGKGSYVQTNGGDPKRMHVSDTKKIESFRAVMSGFHSNPLHLALATGLGIAHTTRMGSAGLKAATVAEGEHDVYFHTSHHTCEWDTCAGDIILAEAGGTMTDLHGQPLLYNQTDVNRRHGILASNGVIHKQLVEEMQDYLLREHSSNT